MSTVHERLLATARNLLGLSSDSFRFRRYFHATQEAASALGMLNFLAEDPETPDDVLVYVKKIHEVTRKRVYDAHLRMLRSRLEPRLSGQHDLEVEAANYVDSLDETLRNAAQSAIEEVGP